MNRVLDPYLSDATGTAFLLGLLVLVTVVVVVAIWRFADVRRSRASSVREVAYRTMAERIAEAQTKNAEALADIRARLAAVEKLLREVE